MGNVYKKIDHFYTIIYREPDWILSRADAERYIRRLAWHGTPDDELIRIWIVIQNMILCVRDMKLDSLYALTIYDYQKTVHDSIEEDVGFQADEASVRDIFAIIKKFFAYYRRYLSPSSFPEEAALQRQTLKEALASFYDENEFFIPKLRSKKEFYTSLNYQEILGPDMLAKLDAMMDGLLKRIDTFYHQDIYLNDLERATHLFCGPDGETGELLHQLPEESSAETWMTFWDYFLFDYHLLESDEVPLQHFLHCNKEKLSLSEIDMLRDMLQSEFMVFTIEEDFGDSCSCCNLLTNERLTLPRPDLPLMDVKQQIFYGHVHLCGLMMTNHIVALPASPRLRRRMKEILLRQLAMFRCQRRKAPVQEFLQRESALVRHTLHIMSSFAQLNVLPIAKIPKALPKQPLIHDAFQEEEAVLAEIARHIGFSRFAIGLIWKLFEDYLSVSDSLDYPDCMPGIMTACLYTYGSINGLDFTQIPRFSEVLGAKKEDVLYHLKAIHDRLDCRPFDPRYLTEEGFVTSLYLN
ncbi:hypothetical protein [Mitsuokella sp.]|uniref:hypothetical protein n=1 Tax=Mitsuokella sp. TaxID=2049034 RepID=UPI002A8347BC|nr:hypothetical protein [Mitsuokella sp.]MDY4474572.1 hypothetical protein [Mitsuokella sp.]